MATTVIVPITTDTIAGRTAIKRHEIDELTLPDLNVSEADLEEFVRNNISAIFPSTDETLLVIGQQVRNTAAGRADLVAVDGRGDIVLIELKRDQNAAAGRREPFEFQAIRYAANYALIKTQQDIVQQLFAPYIERHQNEQQFQLELQNGLTPSELASRLLGTFLQDTRAQASLNRLQRVVLVAASYDPQTLSACAWMASNGIDIRCITISPMRYSDQFFFKIEQVIPPPSLEDYYVNIAQTPVLGGPMPERRTRTGQSLPRMSELFAWGIVTAGDILHNRVSPEQTAVAVNAIHVTFNGNQMRYNEWGQKVTGWSAINIYEWTVQDRSGQTLDALRRTQMNELAQDNEDTRENNRPEDQP